MSSQDLRRERTPVPRWLTCPDCQRTLYLIPDQPRVCCGRKYSIEIEAYLVTSTAS